MTNEEIIKEIKQGNQVQENMYLLYTQNLSLLKRWSKKYINALSGADALQECYIALHNAVCSFDLSKEYKFTTYLQRVVITHLIKVCGNRINDPDRKLLKQYRLLNYQHQQITGNDISIQKASELLQCSPDRIKHILQYLDLQHCASIDKPMSNGSDNDMSLADLLPDKTNIEKEYERQDNKEQLKRLWSYVGNICTDKEQDIIILHYKNNVTLTQLAISYGISISGVEQFKKQALKKLKNDEQFREWAKSFDYCADIAFHYGYSSWKNNDASAVEIATEVREHYKKRMEMKEEKGIDKQKSTIILDMISKGLLPSDFKY